jgi:hypothetical protein
LQLDRFHRARPDVETDKILLATFFEHDLFNPRDEKRANFVLLTEAGPSFHRS